MRLNLNHPIVYCPRCHSLNVRLQYDDPLDLDKKYRSSLRMEYFCVAGFFGGLVGFVGMLFGNKRNANGSANWVCQDCANMFPVNGGKQR